MFVHNTSKNKDKKNGRQRIALNLKYETMKKKKLKKPAIKITNETAQDFYLQGSKSDWLTWAFHCTCVTMRYVLSKSVTFVQVNT